MVNWEKMPNLSKFSLIIPTFDRELWALRQLRFWSGSPIETYILDGNKKPFEQKYLNKTNGNIHYHHMPISIMERYKKVMDLIDTEYVALLYDDEFYIPSAIDSCIGFLENHKDYVSCTGPCIGFCSSSKGLSAKKQKTINPENTKINDETTTDRMFSAFHPYNKCAICSIQRTVNWKKSFDLLTKYDFGTPYFTELQFQLSTSYQGKMNVINELMWLRNFENKPFTSKDWDRSKTLSQYMKETPDVLENAIIGTTRDLAKIDGADEAQVLNDFKQASDCFWMRHASLTPKNFVLHKLLELLPKKSVLKLRQMNIDKRWNKIRDEAEIIQKNNVKVDMEQLDEIIKYITGGYDDN